MDAARRRPCAGAALAGVRRPHVGAIMEFRVVSSVPSVDAPGQTLTMANSCGLNDKSQVPAVLTEQIPIVTPVRTRVVEFGRSGTGDSRDPTTGQCTPDCPEKATFPWTIKINGEAAHSFNANRISLLIPKPGEVEHWTYINGGGGWDHPIHLHFEEGVTMNRGGAASRRPRLGRKDVWRLRLREGPVPGAVRRIWRLLRQPLPQYGARGLRHAHALSAARRIRPPRWAHADTDPLTRWRDIPDARDSARG